MSKLIYHIDRRGFSLESWLMLKGVEKLYLDEAEVDEETKLKSVEELLIQNGYGDDEVVINFIESCRKGCVVDSTIGTELNGDLIMGFHIYRVLSRDAFTISVERMVIQYKL